MLIEYGTMVLGIFFLLVGIALYIISVYLEDTKDVLERVCSLTILTLGLVFGFAGGCLVVAVLLGGGL